MSIVKESIEEEMNRIKNSAAIFESQVQGLNSTVSLLEYVLIICLNEYPINYNFLCFYFIILYVQLPMQLIYLMFLLFSNGCLLLDEVKTN